MFLCNARRVAIAAATVFSIFASAPLYAADPAPQALTAPVMIVVDPVDVLNQSEAMKSIREQSAKYEAQFREQIAGEENTLNKAAQDLEKQRSSLSADAYAEKKRAFDRQLADYQRKARGLRVALEKSNRQAIGQIQAAIVDITGQLAQEKGANVVLSKTQLVLFDNRMEMTPIVLARLNQKLPKVTLPTPKVEENAAAPAAAPAKGKK